MPLRIKRVYEKAAKADGFRVLVDRLWPRGLSKEDAALDEWLKDVAPSSKLRKWFGHDPSKWEEFRKRYFSELEAQRERLASLKDQARKRRVTLLFGAKDERFNNAMALKEFLET
jgi:uncharacterized protein YeaO (DUF488 family)